MFRFLSNLTRKQKILGGTALGLFLLLSLSFCSGSSLKKSYRTVTVQRGEIVQRTKATGTIQPIESIQVGTQVNGPIKKLLVDFNDHVKEGQIVALIDPVTYEARVASDKADLQRSQASVEQVQANLHQAELEWTRVQDLVAKGFSSQSDMDQAQANRDSLLAQIKLSRASVMQAEATLKLSQANLEYTIIHSPIDGVVIARNVTEGQTVVASMTAQTLFVIANDLRKIQVEASVPEADVGKLKEGQPVIFTVDAFQDEEFKGKVLQVRMASSTTQNVVTYPVIVVAENPEGKLFPGMTANLSFETMRVNDVLKAPSAALRFKPDTATQAYLTSQMPPEPKKWKEKSVEKSEEKTDLKKTDEKSDEKTREKEGTFSKEKKPLRTWLYILGPDGLPQPRSVLLGINDGIFTEIKDGLKEGDVLITGIQDPKAIDTSAAANNPFAPARPPSGAPRR